MMDDYREWDLKNAQVGSTLWVKGPGWDPDVQLLTVTKTTKSNVTSSDGSKWARNGRRWGQSDSYFGPRAYLVTDMSKAQAALEEIVRERNLEDLRASLRDRIEVGWRNLTLEQCEGIRKALDMEPEEVKVRVGGAR